MTPLDQMELAEDIARFEAIDPELLAALGDETCYTKKGRLKLSALARKLGIKDRFVAARLEAIRKELG